MTGHKRRKLTNHTSHLYDQYEDKQWGFDNRERKVWDLVNKYESLREPSAALRHIHRDDDLCRLFFEIIEQQIRLIKSRCQEFDDGHVTVFDKALKELSCNGSTARALGVQELYIREYIGINPEAPLHTIEGTLTKNISIKSLLAKKRYSPPETDIAREVSKECPPYNHTDTGTYGILKQDPIVKEEQPTPKKPVEALLKLYFDAKKDFYNLKSENYEKKAVAAKYLRDSAENALLYLQKDESLSSAELRNELQTVFEYSRSMCVAFLGGKKRPFEVERGPRSRRRSSYRYSPYPRNRSNSYGGFAREARHSY